MDERVDSALIERARQLEFVALWWEWLMRYQDDASNAAPPAPPFPHIRLIQRHPVSVPFLLLPLFPPPASAF
jgi:hypothetical protein